jgi:hypothetical protein
MDVTQYQVSTVRISDDQKATQVSQPTIFVHDLSTRCLSDRDLREDHLSLFDFANAEKVVHNTE